MARAAHPKPRRVQKAKSSAALLNDMKKEKDNKICKKYTTRRRVNAHQNRESISEEEMQTLIEQLDEELKRQNEEGILKTLETLKEYTIDSDSVDTAIGLGILPFLGKCLDYDDEDVRYSTVWVLTNVACGDSDQTSEVSGLLEKIVPLVFSSTVPSIVSQCLWFTANIAGDSRELRDLVFKQMSFNSLKTLIREDSASSVLENIAWLTSNIVRQGKLEEPMSSHALGIFRDVLAAPNCDCAVVTEACRGILHTIHDLVEENCLREVANSQVVQEIVRHSQNYCTRSCFTDTVKLFADLLSAENHFCQTFIEHGALTILAIVMEDHKEDLLYYGTFAIANVFACTAVQIEAAIQHGLLAAAILNLEHHDFKVQKEATISLCSFLENAQQDQVQVAFNKGLVPPFVQMLNTFDTGIMHDVLASLFNLMKHGTNLQMREDFLQEILDSNIESRIRQLTKHDAPQIATLAKDFTELYLKEETNNEP